MRLKKSQFKKIITLISIFIGIAVIVCVGNIFLTQYLSSQNASLDEQLSQTDSYGGFEKLKNDFTDLTDKIKTLNDDCSALDAKITETNTQKEQTQALYDKALAENEELKKTGSDEYEALRDKYTATETQYKDLLEKYNKLKEG